MVLYYERCGQDPRSRLIHTTCRVLGFGALVGERDTARNNENKWVSSFTTERGVFTGVIFLNKPIAFFCDFVTRESQIYTQSHITREI
jgi:hypothetical protein